MDAKDVWWWHKRDCGTDMSANMIPRSAGYLGKCRYETSIRVQVHAEAPEHYLRVPAGPSPFSFQFDMTASIAVQLRLAAA
jgi:hypothetical protein